MLILELTNSKLFVRSSIIQFGSVYARAFSATSIRLRATSR